MTACHCVKIHMEQGPCSKSVAILPCYFIYKCPKYEMHCLSGFLKFRAYLEIVHTGPLYGYKWFFLNAARGHSWALCVKLCGPASAHSSRLRCSAPSFIRYTIRSSPFCLTLCLTVIEISLMLPWGQHLCQTGWSGYFRRSWSPPIFTYCRLRGLRWIVR